MPFSQPPIREFPNRIGDYVPERLLGRGAMAAVYLCRSPDGGPVALKWLDHPHPPLLRRFDLEIRSLKRLRHPSIVRFIDHGSFQGRPFLVMEHIDGPDLRTYARKLHQRPPAELYSRCRTIGQALAEALAALHDRGLIHRDVKPSNVLVDHDGRVVLTDFGVVKDAASPELTSVGQLIGTVAYAAPEQLRCEAVDPRADLFGLGASLYFLLTLRRPFDGIARDSTPPLPSRYDPTTPAALESVVMRLLSPDPRRRYGDARQAAKALATGEELGISLAGHQRLLEEAARCLERVAAGEAIIARAVGAPGTHRGWLVDTLLHGAQRQRLPVWTPADGEDSLRQRLSSGEAFLGVLSPGSPPPSGVPVVEIHLKPLGLAAVRRSLIAAAPLTADPAQTAERLYCWTGGLPALLIPLLTEHISGAQLTLPDEIPEPAVVSDFLDGLDLDELDALAALAILSTAADAALIEEVAMVSAADALPALAQRGLVECVGGLWRVVAELFAAAARSRAPDPEGLAERAEQAQARWRSEQPPREPHEEVIARIEQRNAAGDLAEALALARQALVRAHQDPEQACQARCALGQVLLDLGMVEEATRHLADATAQAKASDLQVVRRRSHILRARAALEARADRRSAAAAIDRLMPLVIAARRRPPDSSDALLLSTWARAAGTMGDRRAWQRADTMTREHIPHAAPLDRRRAWLALAQAAAAIGERTTALDALEQVEDGPPMALLSWEAGRLRAALTGAPPPPTSPLAYGLQPEELAALKHRAVHISRRLRLQH